MLDVGYSFVIPTHNAELGATESDASLYYSENFSQISKQKDVSIVIMTTHYWVKIRYKDKWSTKENSDKDQKKHRQPTFCKAVKAILQE